MSLLLARLVDRASMVLAEVLIGTLFWLTRVKCKVCDDDCCTELH